MNDSERTSNKDTTHEGQTAQAVVFSGEMLSWFDDALENSQVDGGQSEQQSEKLSPKRPLEDVRGSS